MSLHLFAEKARRGFVRIKFRLVQWPRILLYQVLSSGQVSGSPKLHQPLLTVGRGFVEFSRQVNIGYFPSPYFFSSYSHIEARNSTARISIGEGTWINNGFCAIAEFTSITIGKNVLIGTNVEILDSDFHGMDVADRNISKPEWAKPVVVEDDVFLGSNVRVMKGVTIGKGSVVANSAIVVKNIPSGVIAGGNPAKVLKMLAEDGCDIKDLGH